MQLFSGAAPVAFFKECGFRLNFNRGILPEGPVIPEAIGEKNA
jgi:hypothetical protein